MKYRILSASTIIDLEELVLHYLKNDYKLAGGVFVISPSNHNHFYWSYLQTVYKEEKDE